MANDIKLDFILNAKNNAGPALKKVAQQTQDIQERMSKITKTAAIAFAGVGVAIGGAIAEASKFEDIGVQFEVLTGSVETATDALNQLKEFSAGTPFQFEGIAKAGKQLLGFGFGVDELSDRLREIGDVAAAAGKPIDEISLIFGQVAAAGKLTGERLLQFQERAIPIGPAIAKTMGIAENAVKDTVSKGLVDLETFQEAFASLSEEGGFAFEGLGKLSLTLSGKISTLKDNFSLLVADIGKKFLPVAKKATDALIKLIQYFRENPAIARTAAAILGLAAGLTGLTVVLGGAILLISKTIVVLGALSAAIVGVSISLKTALISTGIGAIVIGLVALITDLAFNWEKRVGQMKAIWEGFSNFLSDTKDFLFAGLIKGLLVFYNSWVKTVDRIKALWTGFIDFFRNSGRLIKAVFKGIFDLDVNSIKKGLKDFSDSTKKSFGEVGDKFSEANKKYNKFKEDVTDKVKLPDVELKFDFPKDKLKQKVKIEADTTELIEGYDLALQTLKYGLNNLDLKAVGAGLYIAGSTAIDQLENAFNKADFSQVFSFGNIAKELTKNLSSGAEGARKTIVSLGTQAAKAMFGPAGEAIGALLDVFSQGPEKTREFVREFVRGIPKVIEGIIEAIPVFIEELAAQFPYLMERLTAVMVEKFTVGTFWIDIAGAFIEAIIKSIPRMIPAMARGFRDGILSGFKQAFDKLGSLWKNIFKFDGGGRGPVEKFLGFDFPFLKFAKGGLIGGKVFGGSDSESNDIIPALLSPGEVVVPKTAVQGGASGIFGFLEQLGVTQNFGFGGFVKSLGGSVFNAVESAAKKLDKLSGGVISGVGVDLLNPLGPIQNKILEAVTKTIGKNLLPKGLREIVESLLRLGAEIDIPKLIANPKGEISNVVKGLTGSFKPNFMKLLGTPLEKGGVVPNGFNNDTFPARLTSGELVVDRSQNKQLQSFLDGNTNQPQNLDTIEDLLISINNKLDKPQKAEAKVELNSREFANILLELNRSNARITA